MGGNQDDDELMNVINGLSVEDKAAVLKYAKSMSDNGEGDEGGEMPMDADMGGDQGMNAPDQNQMQEKKEISFGDLVIEEETCLGRCNHESVMLTSKEMTILLLLVSHNGKVVSADLINKSAWDTSSYSTSENVWVFISYLRKKLESIHSKTKIKSLRYQGYYLEMIK